ncbi:uncharacterized protein LOC128213507 isoform X2 [Mya arenaria]|uniref:uncharacterized protein LOC128213507 isoform X2 n=1 Tax=Mya arenaria TaxID=6604 RepID=UPI0022E7153B|nr:uncharacterized protein LOC128213507 isoform X2 [Mya arenaria]
MLDMEYKNQSVHIDSCVDTVVTVNQMDETCVQIIQLSGCCIIGVVFLMVAVGAFAFVVHKNGQHKSRDDSQSIQQPLEQHQYLVPNILKNTEAPANSPIIYVVDHDASGCPEQFCQRCSASVPDQETTDENIRGRACKNICLEFLRYDYLIEKIGHRVPCGGHTVIVECCLLKSSQNASYCKNGGRLECFRVREEPRCVCPPGWTGDTCATPRKTQVQCSCYFNELIGYRELIGQRFVPECASSDKPSRWKMCHMDSDKFNCICNKTDTKTYEDSTTASSELPTCSSVDNSHTRRHRSTESTGQTLDTGGDVIASLYGSSATHILSGHLTTVLVFVLTACIRNTG